MEFGGASRGSVGHNISCRKDDQESTSGSHSTTKQLIFLSSPTYLDLIVMKNALKTYSSGLPLTDIFALDNGRGRKMERRRIRHTVG